MELKGSLPCLQEPNIGLYFELDDFGPYSYTLFL
jgi:hypothetical protein